MTRSAKRFFSTLVLFFLLITLFSWHSPNTSGATLVQASDTMTRLKVGVSSTHTILFKAPTGLNPSQKIKISFATTTGFNFGGATSSSALVDVDLATSTALNGTYNDHNLVAGTSAVAGSIAFSTSTAVGQLIFTFINATGSTTPSSTYFRIKIGTNASSGGSGATNLVNPASATSSMVTITTTDASDNVIDRGYLSVVILTDDEVQVTASVLSNLTFNWNATSSDTANGENCVNSLASTTNRNAIEFGTLTPAVSKIACQRLWVATNAANGFSVTAQQNHNLWQTGSTTIDINSFKDGVAPSASTTGPWASPAGTTGSADTYGHFGFTSSDGAVSSASSTMFTNTFYGGFNSTNPFEIFYHNAPVNATSSGDGLGYADVIYKIEISAFQEAGDYSNAVQYVATAVF